MHAWHTAASRAESLVIPEPISIVTDRPIAPDPLRSPHGYHGDLVAAALGVDASRGLTPTEVARRIARDGPNSLEISRSVPWWLILVRQFTSIVVWLLFAAAVVAWLTSGWVECAAILVVLLVNAIIGFVIEWRADRALEALHSEGKGAARVRRDGHEHIVDAAELVVGDVIIVDAGDKVPADVRLIEAYSLRADESTFSGESAPVEKSVEPVQISSILADRCSMLYLGTLVMSGRGLAIVTATGKSTELGRIAHLVSKTGVSRTPLERRLESLGRTLVYIVLAIAVVILAVGVVRGDDPWLMLIIAISLAVAAVPEALPAMTTLILALGVLRMARERAIVRKLTAVEALGNTTVICTDKTGTLTENRMTVTEYKLANGEALRSDSVDVSKDGLQLLLVSLLCNDAALYIESGNKHVSGDPTEIALLLAASKLHVDTAVERSRYDTLREYPFQAASRRMTIVLREKGSGNLIAAVKGGSSVVLDMCSTYLGEMAVRSLNDEKRNAFHRMNDDMAGRGLRVLAFAQKLLDREEDDVEEGFTFLGFAGLADPARHGVKRAIRSAQDAGIRVVMLTGDQAITARAIAGELNLSKGGDVYAMHSSELAGMDDTTLAEAASRAHVFARVSPEDKLRIVKVLQKAGEIVAVTGDGINDAPALKRSDIGIAMGMRGTEVAKEAADIILTDDNFATIVKAIERGRTIYANIIKFVHLLFSHNLGEVLVIFVGIIAGFPLPLLPLQILWLNIITDVFPALALAVEPASERTMKVTPRPAKETLLSGRFLFLISWQGVMLAAITFSAYLWALGTYGVGPHARTVALLAFIGVQFGHTFNCRSRTRSAFNGFFTNPYIFVAAAIVICLQAAAFIITPLREILGLVLLRWIDALITLGCIVMPVVIVELTKMAGRRYRTESERS